MIKVFCIVVPSDTPVFKVGTQLLSSNVSVIKADTVRVTCESTSGPGPPTYRWTGQSSGTSVLTINNTQSALTQTCTATNTMRPTVGSDETQSSSAALNIVVMSKFLRALIETVRIS